MINLSPFLLGRTYLCELSAVSFHKPLINGDTWVVSSRGLR